MARRPRWRRRTRRTRLRLRGLGGVSRRVGDGSGFGEGGSRGGAPSSFRGGSSLVLCFSVLAAPVPGQGPFPSGPGPSTVLGPAEEDEGPVRLTGRSFGTGAFSPGE